MNFIEMQDELASILQDSSPRIVAGIKGYINEAVQQIAEEVKFPELRQVTSITTSTSLYYVNMVSTFSSRLLYCGNSDGEYIPLDTLEELIRLHPSLDEVGDIEDVVLEGNVFYYHPVPAVAVTLTCLGYHVPATLVSDSDTLTFIPSYLHREAIVNKAASIGYSIIEEETEGEKVNMTMFAGLASIGISKLRNYVSKRRPVTHSSVWRV